MKFKEYLNEEGFLDIIDMEKIKKDCFPYFKNLKKSTQYNFLYSGRRSSDIIVKKKIRKDRKPLDTPEILHNLLDKKFKEKFGVKARSEALFAKKK